MRIARVIDEADKVALGVLRPDGALLRAKGSALEGGVAATDEPIRVKRWLPPVQPSAILCIGLNYAKHAAESRLAPPRHPVLFMKNPASATAHGEAIRLPACCGQEVDYECELCVVIGRSCRNVSREKALDYVCGYTAGNDVSARLWQMEKGGTQWCRGKSFDTFCPLGPALADKEEIANPNALGIRTRLNGKVVQESSTSDMIFDVPELVRFLSQDTTLLPGTVIMTGTPSGIGWARNPKVTLQPGDVVEVEIDGIGVLRNPVGR